MCSIAGVVRWSGATAAESDRQAVARMVRAQHHRGPDDSGVVQCQTPGPGRPAVTLGNTRLAILDLSADGHQPMRGQDPETWLVYNGETYNFSAIRDELDALGCRFHSNGDTEVVLRAYEQWGHRSIPRLRGMFASAYWDGRQQRLTLVRDRLGIKPLYYYEGRGYFVFASEVRALLASDLVPRRLDRVSVDQYLAYQTVPGPRTLVEGVRLLPAGHLLTLETGRVGVEPYWDQLRASSEDAAHAGVDEARRRVGELLRESTRLHLVSDVPVGVFLSGGVDSSALVSLIREAGTTPRTFAVTFGERGYDEGPHARAVAQHFGTEHDEIRLDEEALSGEIAEIVAAFDHPSGDAVNTAVVSRAVRAAGLKVALSGLGGDELFGGYPSFARLTRWNPWSSLWGRAPAPVRAMAAAAVEGLGSSSSAAKAAAVLRTDGSMAQAFPPLRQLFTRADRRRLLAPGTTRAADGVPDPYVTLLEEACAASPAASIGTLVSYAESSTYMRDLLLRDTDQMSMASSLEVRVPLLDHLLVEYVTGLPDAVKFRQGSPKSLLTESLGLPLPDMVTSRRKQGFMLPFDQWMRGPLSGYCARHLGAEGLGRREVIDGDAVADLWRRFLARDRRVTWSRPWTLVVLNAWLEATGVELHSEVNP